MQKPVAVEQIHQFFQAAYDLMLQERLRYQRIPLQTGLLCHWKMQDFEQEARGESLNLSTTGMLANLEATPAPGTLIRVRFQLPGEPTPFALTAYAIRLAGSQQVGLRFVNLSREERWRLVEFSKASLALDPAS